MKKEIENYIEDSVSQERINVELYMEKLLDMKDEYPYGSKERSKVINDGIVLVFNLIKKSFECGVNRGKIENCIELKGMIEKILAELEEKIIIDTLKTDNNSDTQNVFVELLKNYGKVEEEA